MHKAEEERIKRMDEYIGITNISVIAHKVYEPKISNIKQYMLMANIPC